MSSQFPPRSAARSTITEPGVIAAHGQTAASANDLSLAATQLPHGQFGYFLAGRTQGFFPAAGGSQGNLCLGGAIGRLNDTPQILNSGATGTFSLLLDLTMMPLPSGFTTVVAGDTWNFQAWFRDTDPPTGNATSNFTDGLSVLFD